MFPLFNTPERNRLKLLSKINEAGVFRSYLDIPFPDRNAFISDVEFLVIDFETTGLDVKQDAILSIGSTLIHKGRIQLATNKHCLVKVNKELSAESVVIHRITDDRAKQGRHLHNVLDMLLPEMAGRVLLVHYDKIERGFLSAACKKVYGFVPPLMMVDTLKLAKRRLDRLGSPYPPERLRLFNLREEYKLPRYKAHSALEDAIATAELFLVQVSHNKGLYKTKLKDVMV